MGLAFLNKKSFHTGSFQNIEKVWIAERLLKEGQRKTREAQKRLKEERHFEEIKRLQVEAGLIPKSHLQRLDWMYEGGAIRNQSAVEYLISKPFEEADPEAPRPEWRPTLCKESTANQSNEVFTKVHEDPLFLIKQEEMRRRQDILSNPLKMSKLRKELEELRAGRSKKTKTERRHRSRSPRELEEGYGLNGNRVKVEGPLGPELDMAKPKAEKAARSQDYKKLSAEEISQQVEEMRLNGARMARDRDEKYRRMQLEEPSHSKRNDYYEGIKKSTLEVPLAERIRSTRHYN
jgi:hypothetical protein